MDLQEAIMVAQESISREIDVLNAKAKATKRVNIDRLRRVRTLRKAYGALDAEFDRLDALAEVSSGRGPASRRKPDGRVQDLGCRGTIQPAYFVRYAGRWYRTVPLSYMTDDMRAIVQALPVLQSLDEPRRHLDRTRKRFQDLPLWPVGTTEDESGKPPGFDAWLAEKRRF